MRGGGQHAEKMAKLFSPVKQTLFYKLSKNIARMLHFLIHSNPFKIYLNAAIWVGYFLLLQNAIFINIPRKHTNMPSLTF